MNKDDIHFLSYILKTSAGTFIYLIFLMQDSLPIRFASILSLFFTALYGARMFLTPIKSADREKVRRIRADQFISGAQVIFSTAVLLFLATTLVLDVASPTNTQQKDEGTSEQSEQYQVHRLEEYRSQIQQLLTKERWQALEIMEKQALLETVLEIEANFLGLTPLPTLTYSTMPIEKRGWYSSITNEIMINNALLDAESGVDSICCLFHEVHHCYQHALVRLYSCIPDARRNLLGVREGGVYMEELGESYVPAEEDYEAYRMQKCEQDAETYAAERLVLYQRCALGIPTNFLN